MKLRIKLTKKELRAYKFWLEYLAELNMQQIGPWAIPDMFRGV